MDRKIRARQTTPSLHRSTCRPSAWGTVIDLPVRLLQSINNRFRVLPCVPWASIKLEMLKRDLDQTTKLADQISTEIEKLKVESQADALITMYHQAEAPKK
jgi:hypothetical protein